jgi:hypothetical protein
VTAGWTVDVPRIVDRFRRTAGLNQSDSAPKARDCQCNYDQSADHAQRLGLFVVDLRCWAEIANTSPSLSAVSSQRNGTLG